jgi:DNA protecting protein DprA
MDYPIHDLSRARFPQLWAVPAPTSSPVLRSNNGLPERGSLRQIQAQGRPEALALLERLPERGLAVVGTRRPQARARLECRRRLLPLRDSGLIILSGLAHGIDQAAHEAAIDAGLPTIAILGNGLRYPMSFEQERVRALILAADGLILSEYPPEQPALPGQFLDRNRLIAGWSNATWVVQAGFRSGALSTAKHAREAGRTCFATPCFPGEAGFEGNQILIERKHAIALWQSADFCQGPGWTELATHEQRMAALDRQRARRAAPNRLGDLPALILHRLRSQSGAAEVQELFNSATASGRSPTDFFQAVHRLLETGRVVEKNGLLLIHDSP